MESMNPALEQLQKVLQLEQKNGYPNTAVIGGLPKMLSFWESNARRAGMDSAFIERVAGLVRQYAEQSAAERAATVQSLQCIAPNAAKAPPPAPAAATTPPAPAAAAPARAARRKRGIWRGAYGPAPAPPDGAQAPARRRAAQYRGRHRRAADRAAWGWAGDRWQLCSPGYQF